MNNHPRRRPPAVPDTILATIRHRLSEYREAQGLSPETLGRRAGLSVSAVRLIESGRSSPSLGTLCAVADAMGIPVAKLFSENNIRAIDKDNNRAIISS